MTLTLSLNIQMNDNFAASVLVLILQQINGDMLGKDVNTIIEDLVKNAASLIKERRKKEVTFFCLNKKRQHLSKVSKHLGLLINVSVDEKFFDKEFEKTRFYSNTLVFHLFSVQPRIAFF